MVTRCDLVHFNNNNRSLTNVWNGVLFLSSWDSQNWNSQKNCREKKSPETDPLLKYCSVNCRLDWHCYWIRFGLTRCSGCWYAPSAVAPIVKGPVESAQFKSLCKWAACLPLGSGRTVPANPFWLAGTLFFFSGIFVDIFLSRALLDAGKGSTLGKPAAPTPPPSLSRSSSHSFASFFWFWHVAFRLIFPINIHSALAPIFVRPIFFSRGKDKKKKKNKGNPNQNHRNRSTSRLSIVFLWLLLPSSLLVFPLSSIDLYRTNLIFLRLNDSN